ncbi:unnamed protein product [Fusarium venenatum]|uniref:Uncharacterized protein n=1 Tax=Fusarium venenatum TaxID=56646 RepID=A0A2L2TMQ5_9HYPO|nr:uncharacterized protein FVRRES_01078 [Fusarium venenatum]CEI64566.1 unnamed protein product [Fusarium venenatum]
MYRQKYKSTGLISLVKPKTPPILAVATYQADQISIQRYGLSEAHRDGHAFYSNHQREVMTSLARHCSLHCTPQWIADQPPKDWDTKINSLRSLV